MGNITGFTSEVQTQLGYYVYRLIDPRDGQTFYVGKGNGDRVFAHAKDALANYNGISYTNTNEDDVSEKIQQIRDIINSGLEVIHIIHRYGMNEKEAFEVEAAVIDCFPGLTNIQSGHSADRGVCNAELLQTLLGATEFDENDPNIKNIKYVIIKIKDYWIQQRGSIYEAVRREWKVDCKKANKYPYVLAVKQGVVVGVYEQQGWTQSKTVTNRCEFTGKEADSAIKDLFINKRIPEKYRKKGQASPVLYKK